MQPVFSFPKRVMSVGVCGWQRAPCFVSEFEVFTICHPQIPVLQGGSVSGMFEMKDARSQTWCSVPHLFYVPGAGGI